MRSLEVMKEFGGPSVYFHVQAIKAQETSFLSDRHLEMIYATLASWGMHRMGNPKDTKAKLVEFDAFRQSILSQRDRLFDFVRLGMDRCSPEQYEGYLDNLKDAYFALRVSISEATVVAHSKALAHILPKLIPPIDRQYTVRFLTQGSKHFFTKSGEYRLVSLPGDIEAQYGAFKKYCSKIKALFDRCDSKQFVIDKNSFNSSYPKIMDNLIMAFVKAVPKP